MKGSSLRSTALALTLAALLPGALEGQEGGGGDPPPGSYCQGCAETQYDLDDRASCTMSVNTMPDGYVEQCKVEALLVVGDHLDDCSSQSQECSNGMCGRKWKLAIRSTPLGGGWGGCNGVFVGFDERLNFGNWSDLTSEGWDAGNYTQTGGDYVVVYPGPNSWSLLRAACGGGLTRKDFRLELSRDPQGPDWIVQCDDEEMHISLQCASCFHPTQPGN